jgi:molecular chaperone GrpE
MADPTSARQGGSGTEVADDAAVPAAPADGAPEGTDGSSEQQDGGRGFVVRDKRRLDPETGEVRAAYAATDPAAQDAGQPAAEPAAGGGAPASSQAPAVAPPEHHAELEAARAVADERLVDLQRLQAEYVNYRRRVDRDRDVARDVAVASVLEALLPVLDDVHLARQHGDLEGGPFAAIAEKLEAVLARFGLARYGEPGEAFDPTVHEALLRTQAELAEGTTETTVVAILQPGYRAGERVLRAARVAVADPQ